MSRLVGTCASCGMFREIVARWIKGPICEKCFVDLEKKSEPKAKPKSKEKKNGKRKKQ